MNNYEIRVNLTFNAIEKQLRQIDQQTKELGKTASLTHLMRQSAIIRSNLIKAGQQLSQEIAKAQSGLGSYINKANIVLSKGGTIAAANRLVNLAQPYVEALNHAKRLNETTNQLSLNFERAALQARQLNTVMAQSAGATGRALASLTPVKDTFSVLGNTIRNTTTAALRPFAEQLNLKKTALRQLDSIITKIPNSFERFGRAINGVNAAAHRNISILGTWWNHFGRVAIGFTIAYRAMNAFEALLGKTVETIKSAITEAGEFATLQGKLAMFMSLSSKGAINFDTAFTAAGDIVAGLAQASTKSISSVEELSVAMDELAQAGVIIPRNLTKEFVSFADFTSLISQTTGDNVRQLRSEINALMEGQTRANNTLIRAMKHFGILDAQMINDLRHMHNRGKAVELIMKRIHDVWTKFVDKAIASNPALAYQVWEKSIRRTLMSSIALVSAAQGKFNIFADTIKKHIDRWNAAFSGDLTKNNQVRQMAISMLSLNNVLDKALSAFEKMLIFIAEAMTAYNNLNESVKKVIKTVIVWEALVVGFKAIKLLGGLFAALNAGLLRAITNFGVFPTVMLAGAAAVFLFHSAMQAMGVEIISDEDKIKQFNGQVNNLITALNNLKFSLIGAYVGFKLFKVPGGLAGLGIGLTVDLIRNADTTKARIESLKQERKAVLAQLAINRDAYIKAIEQGNKRMAEVSLERIRYGRVRAEEIENTIANLQKQQPSEKETSFMKDWVKQTIDNIALLVDAGYEQLQPVLDRMNEWWKSISTPKIDLSSKMKEAAAELGKFGDKAVNDIEELDKRIGSLSSDMYNKFIKAVNDGNVAKAKLFAEPASDDLNAEINVLTDRLKDLKTRLAIEPKGTTKWYELRAAIADTNATLEETRENLKNIPYTEQLATATNIAKRLNDEFEYIKATTLDGSEAQIKALIALKEKYAGALDNIVIRPEDWKQVDKLNEFKRIMKDLDEATLNWKDGIRAGLNELAKPQVFEQFRDITINCFNSLENAIVNFALHGRKAFSDMIESMLNDLLKLIVRMQIIQPIAQMLNFTSPATESPMMAQGAFWEQRVNYAKGGWIDEHVVGMGLRSGKEYHIGESGPELITPASKVGGDVVVNVYNAPEGTRVEHIQDGSMKRIDIYIDELVASKLAGGSKSASVLRRVYGLTPALAGR